jgi:hypothetical protein
MKRHKNSISDYNFKKAAIYKIVVQGEIDDNWADRLNDMQINVDQQKGKQPISSIVGEITDQSALSGILNTLYELQMTVISVKMLSEIIKD